MPPERETTYRLLMAGVLLLLLWPIATVEFPSMVDYPSHLARVRILRDYAQEPVLQARYVPVYKPHPNLALEILSLYVFPWLSIQAAGKAVLALLMVMTAAGCHWLGRCAGDGRPSWLAPVAALLVYNSTFLYGFVNYNFGNAAFLLSLAAWLRLRGEPFALRSLLMAALYLATFLAHLIGFAALMVSVAALAAIHWRRGQLSLGQALLHLLPFTPSLAIYIGLRSLGEDRGAVVWGSWLLKAKHLASFLITYDLGLTFVYGALLLAALVILLVKARPWAITDLQIAGAVLLALAVAMPGQELFGGSDLDARLAILALLVLLLSAAAAVPPVWARLAFVLALAALSARVVEIQRSWVDGDRLTRSQLELLRAVPARASVYPIFELPAEAEAGKRERHLLHALEYTTVDRLVFWPQLIAVDGFQPVLFRERSLQWFGPNPNPSAIRWERLPAKYDFVYSWGAPPRLETMLPRAYSLVGQAGKGRLYKLAPQSVSEKTTPSDHPPSPGTSPPR
ncbi:MAG TPA: hypothetical protein DEH78_17055 [Solibacterales bacterium]|nr:hypothetical protein [Bryobacterales bacterium]